MARQRMIHPSFHKDEDIARLDYPSRLTFIALWGLADRRGRLEDRPMRIKLDAMPYDNVDMDAILAALATGPHPFICRYTVDGRAYIQIRNFEKFQNPHVKEVESSIPPCPSLPFSTGPAPGQHRASTAESESDTDYRVGVGVKARKRSERVVASEESLSSPDNMQLIEGYNAALGSKITNSPGNVKAAERYFAAGYKLEQALAVFAAVRDGSTVTAKWCRKENHAFEYLIRPPYVNANTKERVLGPLDKIPNELAAAPPSTAPPVGIVGSTIEPPTLEQIKADVQRRARVA